MQSTFPGDGLERFSVLECVKMKLDSKVLVKILLCFVFVFVFIWITPSVIECAEREDPCDNNTEILYETVMHREKCCSISFVSNEKGAYQYVNSKLNEMKWYTFGEDARSDVIDFSCTITAFEKLEQGYSIKADIEFRYYDTDEQNESALGEIDAVIVANHLMSMNQQEQVQFVYDYITENVQYDYDLSDLSQSTYSCIVNKKSVCMGIAKTFDIFMAKLGIESKFVYSPNREHVYILAKVDNEWLYFDPTWDLNKNAEDYEWFMSEVDNHKFA